MDIADAEDRDLPGILAIYNDVVATSTAIYNYAPATLEDRAAWLAGRLAQGYPVLVARDAGGVAGYASFGDWRAFDGYAWTVEHSVHVRADLRRQGQGRRLVEALIPRAAALRKHAMIGCIDADNAGSLALHAGLGFTEVGRFPEAGRKFDRWLDVVFVQRFV
jgi:phosphinothricin acetyltransferase